MQHVNPIRDLFRMTVCDRPSRGGRAHPPEPAIAIALLASILVLLTAAQTVAAAHDYRSRFKPVPTQYIAALADPQASAGDNAQTWGLWRVDPGPRGVRLDDHDDLLAAGGVAPAGWQFDGSDWWLEENGLIMEEPEFPLPPGEYLVTGGRKVLSVLTVHPADADGNSRWELEHEASVHDVTHLGCRSARYTPADNNQACSPRRAPRNAFRVAPGAPMPPVEGCDKQDYAVLIVIGRPIEH
jgi:hypothetical protein